MCKFQYIILVFGQCNNMLTPGPAPPGVNVLQDRQFSPHQLISLLAALLLSHANICVDGQHLPTSVVK